MDEMLYKIKADFLKVLAHPVRLMLIEELKSGEKSVGELVKRLGLGQSTISQHLIALRSAGILKSRQEGTTVYYDIFDHDIFTFLRPIALMLKKKFLNSAKLLSTLGKE